MLSKDDIRTIRYLKQRGKSIRAISETLNLSRATVTKYVEQDASDDVRWEIARASRLDSHRHEIEKIFNDSQKWGKQSLNLKGTFREFTGRHPNHGVSYRAFCAFVQKRCNLKGQTELAAIPVEHAPGDAQIDFCKVVYFRNGRCVDGHGFTMSFPYSNASFIQLYPAENQQCLFHGLSALFVAIDGVPRRILFDNASTAVKAIVDGKAQINDAYKDFSSFYGFDPAFCNPASGNEKGSVERNNSVLRRELLSPPPKFRCELEFNKALIERCYARMERAHFRKKEFISALFARERAVMLPIPKAFFDGRRAVRRRTDKYGIVHIETSRYSVSDQHPSMDVIVKLGAFSIDVYDVNGAHICSHERSYEKGATRIKLEHYVRSLASRPRGRCEILESEEDMLERRIVSARPGDRMEMLLDLLEAEPCSATDVPELTPYKVSKNPYASLIPRNNGQDV